MRENFVQKKKGKGEKKRRKMDCSVTGCREMASVIPLHVASGVLIDGPYPGIVDKSDAIWRMP